MFDPYSYLKGRARGAGLQLTAEGYAANQDAKIVAIGKEDTWVGLSISGLDQLQNASERSLINLLDGRFEVALQVFGQALGQAQTAQLKQRVSGLG